jgi:serine protease Do
LSSFFGLETARGRGVVVSSVVRGSPAEAGGLQAGDIVLEYDGQPVSVWFEEQLPTFEKRIADTPVGRQVPLRILRNGKETGIAVTTRPRAKTEGDQKENREWGFTVREVTEEMAVDLSLSSRRGVLVSGIKPGSFAAEAGLRPGDLVSRMDDLEIEDLEHWSQMYQQAVDEGRAQVLLTVRRGPAHYFHVLRPVYGDPARRNLSRTQENNS